MRPRSNYAQRLRPNDADQPEFKGLPAEPSPTRLKRAAQDIRAACVVPDKGGANQEDSSETQRRGWSRAGHQEKHIGLFWEPSSRIEHPIRRACGPLLQI